MAEPLGGQTVTVYERESVGNRDRRDTGVVRVYPGCSVQAHPGGERAAGAPGGNRTTNGRSSDQRRWRLYAPSGLRASELAQCTVVPGPTNELGGPLRLSFDGAAEVHWDLDGAEDHVTASLTL